MNLRFDLFNFNCLVCLISYWINIVFQNEKEWLWSVLWSPRPSPTSDWRTDDHDSESININLQQGVQTPVLYINILYTLYMITNRGD